MTATLTMAVLTVLTVQDTFIFQTSSGYLKSCLVGVLLNLDVVWAILHAGFSFPRSLLR